MDQNCNQHLNMSGKFYLRANFKRRTSSDRTVNVNGRLFLVSKYYFYSACSCFIRFGVLLSIKDKLLLTALSQTREESFSLRDAYSYAVTIFIRFTNFMNFTSFMNLIFFYTFYNVDFLFLSQFFVGYCWASTLSHVSNK